MAVTTRDNIDIVRREIEEVWNGDDRDAIPDFVTEGFVYHNPMVDEEIRGPGGYRHLIEEYREAVRDFEMTVEEMFGDGDRVATRFTTRGTVEGELRGVEASGERIEVTGVVVDHLSDGKIAERWVHDDALGMLEQLGAIPDNR
ncbi:ester cyclase [Halomarina halobia]|uniref:Ester cyclase n=1 Tax=Halomarina halobia TaxID=3033386 RepID=A0ABD6AB84_9EURY|nr:ester cyclase [Halomarina sp. PSR21]